MTSPPTLELDVHLEAAGDAPVGRLARLADRSMRFAYVRDDLPHALSLALPVREAPYGDTETRAFFGNLLFENEIREQTMARHGVEEGDVVGLLHHLGADCPGALSCAPRGAGPAKRPGVLAADYDVLGAGDLERIAAMLSERRRLPDGVRDPSPLAGVQGKIALVRLPDGGFALPRESVKAPTTHVLKAPRRWEPGAMEDEHLTMTLMREAQPHPVAETELLDLGGVRALLVARFDRRVVDGLVHRLHQEDFAQALGLPAALKYERNGVPGGPRAFCAAAMGEIVARTARPGDTRLALLDTTIARLMLGDTDNHAKNHALLYDGSATKPMLAPVYDVTPVLTDRTVTHEMAFRIGAALMADDMTAEDFNDFLGALGFGGARAALRRRAGEVIARLVARIDELQGGRRQIGDAMAAQARGMAPALAPGLVVPQRDLVIINRP